MFGEVQTLGGFEVLADERPVDALKTRPTCSALLVYLATEGSVTRDTVLPVLWPERDEARARHALSQTIYQLRRILGRQWLTGRGQQLRLTAGVGVDSAQFAVAVQERRYSEAVELYDGRFLEGWHFRGPAEFQHWVDRQVERLAGLFRTACRRGMASCLKANDRAGALALAERWVEREPEGSEAHRELIRLLVEDGKHEAAFERYTAFERRLADMGVVPGPDVVEAAALALARGPARRPGTKTTAAGSEPRIVVLPFAHAGPARFAHLTYGLGDETTICLSRHPGVAVIARSSAAVLAGEARSVTEIGDALQVDHVLEGTVRWRAAGSPATATVSPQLVRVADGKQLWAAQLETDGEAIGDLSARLADRTLAALGLRSMTGNSRTNTSDPPNPEAYELYVRGVQHWHRRSLASLGEAIELFIQAIESYPEFARAYGGLALAYALMPSFVGDTPGTWMPRAVRTAERALALDPASAEGHLAMGLIAWNHHLDAEAAGHHWTRTLELEPSNAQAMIWLGYHSVVLRTADVARRRVREALSLDPLSISTNFDAGLVYWCLGDWTQAGDQLQRVLQIDPAFYPAAFVLGTRHFMLSQFDEARRQWSTIRVFGPAWNTLLASLEDPPRAVAALDRIVDLSPRPVHWYAVAQLYVLFGVPERALFWIDIHLRNVRGEPVSYATGGPSLHFAAIDPVFAPLHSTPKFRAFLRALHLDQGMTVR